MGLDCHLIFKRFFSIKFVEVRSNVLRSIRKCNSGHQAVNFRKYHIKLESILYAEKRGKTRPLIFFPTPTQLMNGYIDIRALDFVTHGKDVKTLKHGRDMSACIASRFSVFTNCLMYRKWIEILKLRARDGELASLPWSNIVKYVHEESTADCKSAKFNI